ncbi:beta-2-microglobulin-like [Colossoma macropomum]|uniref:beta-2-microglobulin-like n=1 Tax=Colossoma macropomum TaxID=42526 RepID=UPI001864F896|nr:beta-2-microglobulin-like [Colossoma macropomum]
MKLLLCFVVACALYVTAQAKESPPKVQVYSNSPGEFGKENVLICHVSGFYPSDIIVELLRNGEKIPGAEQTDLAIDQDWKFHLTKSVSFTPQKEDLYICRVTHAQNKPQTYSWKADKGN